MSILTIMSQVKEALTEVELELELVLQSQNSGHTEENIELKCSRIKYTKNLTNGDAFITLTAPCIQHPC